MISVTQIVRFEMGLPLFILMVNKIMLPETKYINTNRNYLSNSKQNWVYVIVIDKKAVVN
jgi:hypothetical protein